MSSISVWVTGLFKSLVSHWMDYTGLYFLAIAPFPSKSLRIRVASHCIPSFPLNVCRVFWDQVFYVPQAGVALTIWAALGSVQWSFCSHLLSTGLQMCTTTPDLMLDNRRLCLLFVSPARGSSGSLLFSKNQLFSSHILPVVVLCISFSLLLILSFPLPEWRVALTFWVFSQCPDLKCGVPSLILQ
jgi:hypothetical protein